VAGNGAKPVLRVRLLQDGRTIATLRPVKLTDKPGACEVKATITQGGSSTIVGQPRLVTASEPRRTDTEP
jgi:hypothetical protein